MVFVGAVRDGQQSGPDGTVAFVCRWMVAGLGSFMAIVALGNLLISGATGLLAVLEQGLPLAIALAVAAFGGWLGRSDLDEEQLCRIGEWCAAGISIVGLVGVWVFAFGVLQGTASEVLTPVLLTDAGIGAAAGAAVGYYEVGRQAYAERAERAQAAVEASIDGVAILDPDGRYVQVNRAHADIYGYDDPAAFLGKSWRMCYDDDGIDHIESAAMAALDEQGYWRGELTGEREDGSTFPQSVSLTRLDDGCIVCVVRDVTERKIRERRLTGLHEESKQLSDAPTPKAVAEATVRIASQVLDQPYTVMWSYDADSDVLVPFAATEPAREYAEGVDDEGLPAGVERPPADVEGLPSFEDGSVAMETFRGGEPRRIEDPASVEAVPDELGFRSVLFVPVDGFGLLGVGVLSDPSTERTDIDTELVHLLAQQAAAAFRRADREEQIRRRQQTIEALYEVTREMISANTPEEVSEVAVSTARHVLDLPVVAIWLRDGIENRLRPVAWSRESAELFEELPTYTADDGSLPWAVYESGEPRVVEDLQEAERVHNPETPLRSEIVIPLGEHGVLNAASTDPETFDVDDRGVARLLAASTETALDRAAREAELRRQTSQLEFFNSILRHDVLNGMTVIRARAELLESDLDDEYRPHAETILEWCDEIVDVIGRVRQVIERLTGESEADLEPVDASEILSASVERVAGTYPELKVETDIDEGVEVLADDLLAEVLGNVVTNAVEHNDKDEPRMWVSLSADDELATVRVADNGPGVPDDEKEALFRRGETGHAKSTGSGFGLFFVDSMVEEYGGEVWVEDNDPEGAVFVIELLRPETVPAES